MATDTYWQLEHEYYTIATDHDLIVRVIEHKEVTRTEGKGKDAKIVKDFVPNKVHEFKVKRSVVVDSSKYFDKLLDTNSSFKDSQQSRIDLLEDEARSAEIWFKILHGSDSGSSNLDITIKNVWEMLLTAHKYGLDPQLPAAKAWFEAWWLANEKKPNGRTFDFGDYRELLFPCHTFDYAPGFAAATKHLAYNAIGHITEKRPDNFHHYHLRLELGIVQQINAAKGRLKGILFRGLYKPIKDSFTGPHCDCKFKTYYTYEQALFKTGAWPLEDTFLYNSITKLLRMLGNFMLGNFRSKAVGPEMCAKCRFDVHKVVPEALSETSDSFDGLCLDCMNTSNPKVGDADEEYWRHAEQGTAWDAHCRVRHSQPSWYFSFMGHKEKMIEWKKRPRNRNDSGS
ncbi:hypothetical protein LTR37_004788 [Vermiconidia calcicola]|uniref:Uncharacterized protein n=1 Tax=Vermiconidia calcicola TaxID=1690605 RepID=A0ACC3NLP4_9PEZI|nr:hypothetical protein LTR37_004788 [Vermiconidia calcicola]